MFNGFDLSTIQNCYIGGTAARAIYYGSVKIWPTGHDYSHDYFTIVSLANNNVISWQSVESTYTKTISVSTDDGNTWTSYTSAPYTPTVLGTLNNGDKMLIKGNNTVYYDGQSYYSWFATSADYNIEGNIMSLIYEDNFINQTSFPNNSSCNFSELFWHSDKLISAENLILPATTLTESCYANMFTDCTSLTTSPNLPATTLAQGCYGGMFIGCSSLVSVPTILPATTLADYCYDEMFKYCSSLVTAPELPATTLTTRCYNEIFEDCTSLNYIKCLATDISAYQSTFNMTYNVAATGTFVKDATMTSWITGNDGIPLNWHVIDA